MQGIQNSGKRNSPEKENPEGRNEKGILSVLIHELRRNFGPALKEIEVKDVG